MDFDFDRTLEDLAYQSARDSFELKRDQINDKAHTAHYAGDEELAQKLLAEAAAMVYTGLENCDVAELLMPVCSECGNPDAYPQDHSASCPKYKGE